MQELNPGSRFSARDLMRPGCLLGMLGLLIIGFAILRIAWGQHSADPNLDPTTMSTGTTVKSMVWLVSGIGLSIFGALVSYVDYSRR